MDKICLPYSSLRSPREGSVDVIEKIKVGNTPILGIMIPSNKMSVLKTMFLKGLSNLSEISELSILGFNLQNYSDDDTLEVVNILDSHNFSYRIMRTTYDCSGGVPINRISEDTSRLVSDTKILVRCDDDIVFKGPSESINKSAGQQYLEIANYMLTHDKCGCVSTFANSLTRYPGKYKIGPSKVDFNRKRFSTALSTGKGLFLKNIYSESEGVFLPMSIVDEEWVSWREDVLSAGRRIADGYYHAKVSHVRATHVGLTSTNYSDSTDEVYHWRNPEKNSSTIKRWIHDNWNPDYLDDSSEVVILKPEVYLSSGGINFFDDPSIIENYIVDYSKEVVTIDSVKDLAREG